MNRLPILALALLVLAGCDKQQGAERRQAAGEILEGSVSDAMIQTDQVRSEGPYAAPQAAADSKDGKAKAKPRGKVTDAASPSATETGEAPAPTPQATPTPESTG